VEKTCLVKQAHVWDLCVEFTVWHCATKCQLWNLKSPGRRTTSPNRELSATFPLAMCLKCPRKCWRSKSCWLQPQERYSEIVQQGPGGVTTSPTFLGPVDVETRQLSEIADNREVFRVLLGLLPLCPSPEEKWVRKWINEMKVRVWAVA